MCVFVVLNAVLDSPDWIKLTIREDLEVRERIYQYITVSSPGYVQKLQQQWFESDQSQHRVPVSIYSGGSRKVGKLLIRQQSTPAAVDKVTAGLKGTSAESSQNLSEQLTGLVKEISPSYSVKAYSKPVESALSECENIEEVTADKVIRSDESVKVDDITDLFSAARTESNTKTVGQVKSKIPSCSPGKSYKNIQTEDLSPITTSASAATDKSGSRKKSGIPSLITGSKVNNNLATGKSVESPKSKLPPTVPKKSTGLVTRAAESNNSSQQVIPGLTKSGLVLDIQEDQSEATESPDNVIVEAVAIKKSELSTRIPFQNKSKIVDSSNRGVVNASNIPVAASLKVKTEVSTEIVVESAVNFPQSKIPSFSPRRGVAKTSAKVDGEISGISEAQVKSLKNNSTFENSNLTQRGKNIVQPGYSKLTKNKTDAIVVENKTDDKLEEFSGNDLTESPVSRRGGRKFSAPVLTKSKYARAEWAQEKIGAKSRSFDAYDSSKTTDKLKTTAKARYGDSFSKVYLESSNNTELEDDGNVIMSHKLSQPIQYNMYSSPTKSSSDKTNGNTEQSDWTGSSYNGSSGKRAETFVMTGEKMIKIKSIPVREPRVKPGFNADSVIATQSEVTTFSSTVVTQSSSADEQCILSSPAKASPRRHATKQSPTKNEALNSDSASETISNFVPSETSIAKCNLNNSNNDGDVNASDSPSHVKQNLNKSSSPYKFSQSTETTSTESTPSRFHSVSRSGQPDNMNDSSQQGIVNDQMEILGYPRYRDVPIPLDIPPDDISRDDELFVYREGYRQGEELDVNLLPPPPEELLSTSVNQNNKPGSATRQDLKESGDSVERGKQKVGYIRRFESTSSYDSNDTRVANFVPMFNDIDDEPVGNNTSTTPSKRLQFIPADIKSNLVKSDPAETGSGSNLNLSQSSLGRGEDGSRLNQSSPGQRVKGGLSKAAIITSESVEKLSKIGRAGRDNMPVSRSDDNITQYTRDPVSLEHKNFSSCDVLNQSSQDSLESSGKKKSGKSSNRKSAKMDSKNASTKSPKSKKKANGGSSDSDGIVKEFKGPRLIPASHVQYGDNELDLSMEEEDMSDFESGEMSLRKRSKDVDHPSACRLAKRLYTLDGFQRADVAKHLCKNNDFSHLVGEEYLKYFDFAGMSLDEALRQFLSHLILSGETQERERILAHFSRHFLHCNHHSFNSEDSCHTLTCAIMLLNTDLHGQNIGRKMTMTEFVDNLMGLNDGEDFPREVLRAVYQSIKEQPIFFDMEEVATPQQEANPAMIGGNPFLDVPDPSKTREYKKGYIMRKSCIGPDGHRTPLGKRGWKMVYARLCDMVLYMHKDEQGFSSGSGNSAAIRVHHALAVPAEEYTKKQNVIKLQTADWAVYLLQASDIKEYRSWLETINYVAASLSAPPLPSACGSQKKFQRPLLPSSYTKLSLADQLRSHRSTLSQVEKDLTDHRSLPPEKSAKSRYIHDYMEKDMFLVFEQKRFMVYCEALQARLTQSLESPVVTLTPGDDSTGDDKDGGRGVMMRGGGPQMQRSLSDRLTKMREESIADRMSRLHSRDVTIKTRQEAANSALLNRSYVMSPRSVAVMFESRV